MLSCDKLSMRINNKGGTDIEFRAPLSFVSMTRLGESLFVHGSVFGCIERSIIFLCYLLVLLLLLLCILLNACIVSFYLLSGTSFYDEVKMNTSYQEVAHI